MSSPKFLEKDFTGKYIYREELNGHPSYRHESKDWYLFFAGHWKVEPQSNYGSLEDIGYIYTDEADSCPLNVGEKWKRYDTRSIDPQIRVLCASP